MNTWHWEGIGYMHATGLDTGASDGVRDKGISYYEMESFMILWEDLCGI